MRHGPLYNGPQPRGPLSEVASLVYKYGNENAYGEFRLSKNFTLSELYNKIPSLSLFDSTARHHHSLAPFYYGWYMNLGLNAD